MPFDVELRSHTDTSGDGGFVPGLHTVDRADLADYETQILANDLTFHLPIKDLDGLNRELNKQIYNLYQSDEAAASAGFVVGPLTATDNAIARWDGVTGELLQDSLAFVSDLGIIIGQGLNIMGSVSGSVAFRVPSAAGSNTITFPAGTTDFSATGGSSQVVKQVTAGGAFTVGALVPGDVGLGNVTNVAQQPLDTDLTEIAAIVAADDDIIQQKAGVWVNRTPAQYKADLVLVKADVGLSNVDNIQQQPLDSDLTSIAGLSPSDDDIIQRKAGVWTNRSLAQYKSDLALNNVTNVAQMPLSYLSTDGTLASNSDVKVPTEQAVKTAIDAMAMGLRIKASCRVATVSNITLSGTFTHDGVALIAGDRVLVMSQSTGADNGIYVVAAGAWSRATDADVSAEVKAGMFTFSTEGTANADKGWVLATNDPITLGSTSLTFTQFSSVSSVLATDVTQGITKLSFAAVSGSDPIAVGQNDPIWRGLAKTYYLDTYGHTNAGFASAISAIAATSPTPAMLAVTESFTITASHTMPSNCILAFNNGSIITLSGSITLTITKMDDPGNVQCFAGVSASNHVLFSSGAVPKFNIAWYLGIGSSSDATFGMTDIFSSITTASGGTVLIPAGSWKVNDLTCPEGLRLEGVAQGMDPSDVIGSRLIPRDGSTAYLLRTLQNQRNIALAHLTLSIGTNTTTRAFRTEGTSGSSVFGVSFDHCTFVGNGATSHYPLLSDDNDQAYEVIGVQCYNCQFQVADNSKGAYLKSVNSQWQFLSCRFQVGAGDSYGIDAFNAGIVAINCDFRGVQGLFNPTASTITTSLTCSITSGSNALTTTGGLTKAMEGQKVAVGVAGLADHYISRVNSATSATLYTNATATVTSQTLTVYKWGNNAARAGVAIRLGNGGLLTSTIDSNSEEGFNYFLTIFGNSYLTPITLTNNRVQAKILSYGSCNIYTGGNRFQSNVWGVDDGAVVHVYGTDNYDNNTVEMQNPSTYNPLVEAKEWGPERDGYMYFHDHSYREGTSVDTSRYWKQIIEGSQSALTRPILDVLTTFEDVGSSHQLLQRWGVADAVGESFKYGLQLWRDVQVSPGYFVWECTQEAPYRGWHTQFGVGYGDTVRGAITQITSRDTTVSCHYLHGIITAYSATALPAGGFSIFQVDNTWVQNGDTVLVQIVDGATSELTEAWCSRVGGNFFKVTVLNKSQTASDTGTLKIKFHVVKDGGQVGISY